MRVRRTDESVCVLFGIDAFESNCSSGVVVVVASYYTDRDMHREHNPLLSINIINIYTSPHQPPWCWKLSNFRCARDRIKHVIIITDDVATTRIATNEYSLSHQSLYA